MTNSSEPAAGGEKPQAKPLRYLPSSKHCEPITAAKPGTKCPRWSAPIAQRLLDESVVMGAKRVATSRGLAFVAQRTSGNDWHGYPEAWDKIDRGIKDLWLQQGLIRRRDLTRWGTPNAVWWAWKEFNDAHE